MSRTVRFAVALVAGLALLAWLASAVVQRTTNRWFDKDLRLRADLAVSGARQALVGHWRAERATDLNRLLSDLTHDERIMAAAACSANESELTRTELYPERFGCGGLAVRMRDGAGWRAWNGVESVPGGRVYVSAIPVMDLAPDERTLGFVVLVHDLSFVERRDAATQRFLFLIFGFLALAAAAVTIIAARWSWRDWSAELRRFIRGGALPGGTPGRSEFQPILSDVRDLVDRIVAESELDREAGAWTPQRLRQILARHLHGERVVIVANREPYIHHRDPADGGSQDAGRLRVLHPASGLVTALEPVMRACSGVWIAHGSGNADRETADRHGRVRVPPGEESYTLRRVWLSAEEERGYYYGFANEGLWPLCHAADARPDFRQADWHHYRDVNSRFADTVCEEVDTDDPIVLVQDYHFALAPRLIRERLPRATVIMFWHSPWPGPQRLGICPWREELLEGILGASIIGFHTQSHCNNFVDSVDRYLEARIDREQQAVVRHGRATMVRPYPISIEWPVKWMDGVPSVAECRARVREELDLPPDALLGVGVDRLDYTKGIEERILAVERLFERFPSLIGRFTFAQWAAPSRTEIDRYRELNERVEQATRRVQERFGRGGWRPVILLRGHHEPPAVFRAYRAADVCYVSSLDDGMNLVAKEFVAARDDEQGALVLSQFTGAARELTEALIVNPYDLDEAASALAAALQMTPDEQRDRMRAMRGFLAQFNVYRWAGRMLVDAARLRSRDRLTGRLSDPLVAVAR